MWLYVVRPKAIGVPRAPTDGCSTRRVDDRGDPSAAALGAQAVLVVVAPDEELRARQADPLDQVAGEQDAVERDHDAADQAVRPPPRGRRPSRARHGYRPAAGSGRPAARGRTRRRRPGPRSRGAVVGQERLQAAGLGQTVVVHQPDQVGAALDGPAQALVEATGTPGVVAEQARVQVRDLGLGRAQPRPRAVGGGVVDDQDLVDPIGVRQGADQMLQQRQPVEGDHDRAQASVGRGHLRTLVGVGYSARVADHRSSMRPKCQMASAATQAKTKSPTMK